ncbi:MAG: efflux RND transporter periplasmic adaptor subunit [Prevotellaceae bacterium]|jgi:membrane fusion protein (multidrug efflux system)|nr:efflux RND transporter periplasmic adaptor subunit [Prevotellaceae bacterium]
MSKKTKTILFVAIGLLIAGIALYPVISRNLFAGKDTNESSPGASRTNTAGSRRTLTVNAEVIKHSSLQDYFRTKGLLIPDEEVDLSFETSGKITNIYLQEGRFVKRGTLLAKINDKPLQAELEKLKAQLPLAQDRVNRQKLLLEKDAVSKESFESVNTELEKLYADISLVKARIEQTELRAPFDGLIGLRQVSEGAYVSPSSIVTRLTKISPLKIEFSVNESQANSIRPGMNLKFTVGDDLINVYNAEIYAVESRLDQQTLTLKARALYPNTNNEMRPGHSANVEVQLDDFKNSLIAPSIAVLAEMGRDIVYIYRDGAAWQTEIRKGIRNQSHVQILQGVDYGDTLITTGVMQLRDGMSVKIADLKTN